MRGAPRNPAFVVAATSLLVLAGCWLEHVPEEEGEEDGSAAAAPTPARVATGLHAALDSSAVAWNRGDLSGFLATYRRDSTVTYVGGSGLRRGFREIRERYAPLFREGAARDSLRFTGLDTRLLTDRHALTTGRYVLHRGEDVTSTGMFSLVWVRSGDGWRIVHDHSSEVPFPSDTGAAS